MILEKIKYDLLINMINDALIVLLLLLDLVLYIQHRYDVQKITNNTIQ